MSTLTKIFWVCLGVLVHTTVFITVGVAIVVFLEFGSGFDQPLAQRFEYLWNAVWSWRGQRFALALVANAVCLPAAVGAWSTGEILAHRRPGSGLVLLRAGLCTIAGYAIFMVAETLLAATAPFRITAMAGLSFLALAIFVFIWDIFLFAPLSAVSSCIVGGTLRRLVRL